MENTCCSYLGPIHTKKNKMLQGKNVNMHDFFLSNGPCPSVLAELNPVAYANATGNFLNCPHSIIIVPFNPISEFCFHLHSFIL